jgi:glycosyltransferase involved in cell wall biosynthesis
MSTRAAAAQPAVSIIVPVHGTEEHLPACLASLLNQTMRDIEVIVVDDHSPGDVADIVAEVANRDQRVRLVGHDRNQGPIGARRSGGRAAKADYLGFVDPDDVVDERFVEAMQSVAIEHDADLVTCSILWTEVDGSTWLANRGGDHSLLTGDDIMHSLLAGRMWNSLGTKLIRTVTWQRAMSRMQDDWVSIRFAEDLLVTFLVVHEVSRYAHVPHPGYRYLRRTDGMSTSPDPDSIIDRLNDLGRVYDVVRSLLSSNPQPPDLVAAHFEREFETVVHDLLGQCAVADGPTGLPRSPVALGLLGAVIANGRRPSATTRTASSSSAGQEPAVLAGTQALDRSQGALLREREQKIADVEDRLRGLEQALVARDVEIDVLERWRDAVERSRTYRLLRAQNALYGWPLLGRLLRLSRRAVGRMLGSRGSAERRSIRCRPKQAGGSRSSS